MEFKFEGRAKIVSQVLMGIGFIALIAGFLTDGSDHHQRWWANLARQWIFLVLHFVSGTFLLRVELRCRGGMVGSYQTDV